MWKKLKKMYIWGGFVSEGAELLLDKGYLVIYKEGNSLDLLSTKDFNHLNLNIKPGSVSKITSNLYIDISYKNKIKRLTLSDFSLEIICETSEKNIRLVDANYCIGSTITRNPKSYSNEIKLLESCENYYSWNYKSTLHFIIEGKLILSDDKGYLNSINPSKNIKVWHFEFEDDFSGGQRYMQLVDDILVIALIFDLGDNNYNQELVGLDIYTGEIRWKLDKVSIFPWYQLNTNTNKLYACGTIHRNNNEGGPYRCYQVIDAISGTLEKNIDLGENNEAGSSHLCYLSEDGYLYFPSSEPFPCINAINTKTHKLEYSQTIDVNPEDIYRGTALKQPIVYKNRMYVMDAGMNLHILELE